MELFFVLLILLVATRSFGELAVRAGQPSLVGELVAGILLGVIIGNWTGLLPELEHLRDNHMMHAITDLGMFFIMLFAGIEMQPHKIFKYSGPSFFVAVGGLVVPLALGAALGWVFLPDTPLRFIQAAFIGTALAITAVPASVRILLDLGKLNSRSGQIIVTAAAFDDVLSLLVLAWLTGLMGVFNGGVGIGPNELFLLIGKVAVFFIITALIGFYVFPFCGKFLSRLKKKEKEMELSVLLIAALAFAVLAEKLDLHFILGAFVAGVFFGRRTITPKIYEDVRNKVSGMTFGFLAPVFFASIGLNLTLSAFTAIPLFLFLLILAAFAGKLIGAGGAAYALGLGRREATAVGVGMSARGAVELVIADIALKGGLFIQHGAVFSPVVSNLFSAVVIMAVVTTLATPILLKRVYGMDNKGATTGA